MKNQFLVEPEDDSRSLPEHTLEVLADCGFTAVDAAKLLIIFRKPSLLDLDSYTEDDSDAGGFIESLGSELKHAPEEAKRSRDGKIVHLLQVILGLQNRAVYADPARDLFSGHRKTYRSFVEGECEAPAWYADFFDLMEVDWVNALSLECLQIENEDLNFDPFLRHVVLPKMPLDKVIDVSRMPEAYTGSSSTDKYAPQDVEFWLNVEFKHLKLGLMASQGQKYEPGRSVTLDRLLPAFDAMEPSLLAHCLPRLVNSLERILGLSCREDSWRLVAFSLKNYCDLASGLSDLRLIDDAVRNAWWLLSVRVHSPYFGGLIDELQDVERRSLINSATEYLGRHTMAVREQLEAFDRTRFRKANEVLFHLGQPWDLIKANLLLFTNLTQQAVAADLRYWPENGYEDQPPQPLCEIPARVANQLYNPSLKAELVRDPELRGLREEFAKFCLARLKTRKTGKQPDGGDKVTEPEFVEPRVWWRRCYAKALFELRVNPGGKSHHVAYWSSRNDPDEQVRKHSKSAYRAMRHQEGLEPGQSPRRPLMAAFWWLRQAHLLHLGVEVDPKGAQRTRTKELRRIKESEPMN